MTCACGNAADFIFSSLYPCWSWGNTILVIEPILGAAGWEPQGSSPIRTRGRQIRSYPLLLVCPRDTPNIWCKFSHTSPDLLIRSGQVKKIFLVRRASERAQEECSKFCLLERAPRRLLFFDFKLRKLFEGCALWIKSQQQNCVFRKSAAELICVRLEFKVIPFQEIYGFDSILGFYYICGQFLLHLWSIIAFVTSTVPLSSAFHW